MPISLVFLHYNLPGWLPCNILLIKLLSFKHKWISIHLIQEIINCRNKQKLVTTFALKLSWFTPSAINMTNRQLHKIFVPNNMHNFKTLSFVSVRCHYLRKSDWNLNILRKLWIHIEVKGLFFYFIFHVISVNGLKRYLMSYNLHWVYYKSYFETIIALYSESHTTNILNPSINEWLSYLII